MVLTRVALQQYIQITSALQQHVYLITTHFVVDYEPMQLLFLNPFHGGSHAAVAEGYARHSQHDITILSLSIAGGWRWRMRGAAITLARQLRAYLQTHPTKFDIIISSDMLDVATFLGLTRDLTARIPLAMYFHENQLTYPLPPGRERDLAFPWINYTSALAADLVCFNSAFHRRAFLEALPGLPGRYHDYRELDLIDSIAAKAHVLPPGIELTRLDLAPGLQIANCKLSPDRANLQSAICNLQSPIILWNSRWEYDKGPAAFFAALRELVARGIDFRVIAAGEHIDPNEPHFLAAREWLGERVLAWGYASDFAAYRERLWQADIVVSCAIQEFFGIGVIEAMYCGCVPVLPRRLSYPELLPAEYHAAGLYEADADLADRLQAVIRDLPALPRHEFRGVAAPYDWSAMAPRYDALFEQIVT
jgi:glycosyltransferase involved in cell wall biosynthesis